MFRCPVAERRTNWPSGCSLSSIRDPRPLPTTRQEMLARGWDELDVIVITGDAYVDHPSFAMAIIGRVLEAAGFRVGISVSPIGIPPTTGAGWGGLDCCSVSAPATWTR